MKYKIEIFFLKKKREMLVNWMKKNQIDYFGNYYIFIVWVVNLKVFIENQLEYKLNRLFKILFLDKNLY